MRVFLIIGVLLPGCLLAPFVRAQDARVNDRIDGRAIPPRSQAEGYLAVTLAQLVVALGLSLQGIPLANQHGTHVVPQLRSLAAVPDRSSPQPRLPSERPLD